MKRTRMKRVSAKRRQEMVQLAELRLYVLERDQYRCRYCRARGVVLDVHHIEKRSQRPDLLLEPLNVLALCRKCHKWTDAAAQSRDGRLTIKRYGQIVEFKIDYEGKLSRLAGVFLPQSTNHVVIHADSQASTGGANGAWDRSDVSQDHRHA